MQAISSDQSNANREWMGQVHAGFAIGLEAYTVLSSYRDLWGQFNADHFKEVGLMLVLDVLDQVLLQIWTEEQFLMEYRYTLIRQGDSSSGPPPTEPPLGKLPPDARMHLIVRPNMRKSQSVEHLDKIGWWPFQPLVIPETTPKRTYGIWGYPSFSVRREMVVNYPPFRTFSQKGSWLAPYPHPSVVQPIRDVVPGNEGYVPPVYQRYFD